MKTSITELDHVVTTQLSLGKKQVSITKDQVLEMCDLYKEKLTTAVRSIENIQAAGETLTRPILFPSKNPDKSSMFASWIYSEVYKNIGPIAERMEQQSPLSSFRATALNYITIISRINAEIDTLLSEKTITIFNAKVSTVAILGLLEEANQVGKFINTFLTCFFNQIAPGTDELAPYILNMLMQNTRLFADLVARNVGSEKNEFAKTVKAFKGKDVYLVSNDNDSNVKLAELTLGELPESTVKQGARGFAIFRWIGNMFFDVRDNLMRRLKQERDLLQTQLDLAKLKMDGISESDPEYQKLVKLINGYIATIASLDKQLQKYYAD